LVAGGAGYIGSHTCKLLAKAGREPVVLDDLSTGHRWAAKFGPLYVGDIENVELVQKIVRQHGITDVIDFAAKANVGESYHDPGKYFRENVGKTIHFLDSLIGSGVKNIVFSSTCAVYGTPQTIPITEKESKKPVNPYGESKLFVERMLYWHEIAHGLKWVAPRYFNAAGADPEGELGELHEPELHLIPAAMEAVMGKRPQLEVYGNDYPTKDGTAIRDYIHVFDLGRAHILALDYLRDGGESTAINLGTGVGQSVLDVVRAVASASGHDVPHVLRPRRAGDPPELVADPARAKSVLGWAAEFRDIQWIVQTAWAWHQRPMAS
jgi:UDP-glucose-4-epimerase GalE